MNYVNTPNLPQSPVKMAIVDGRISMEMERKLVEFGLRLIKTPAYPNVHAAISYHPDIILHHIRDEYIVCVPDMSDYIFNKLFKEGFKVIRGKSFLSVKYPGDVPYNVARVGRYAFHNLYYIDEVLRDTLVENNVELVHVKQGYAKCSVSVVDQNSIITADKGIAKAAEAKGIEVLLINSNEGIYLPGMDSGFIGGSSGLISGNRWVLTGNAEKLISYKKIYDFLYKKGIEIISLSDGHIIDLGTIIPLMTI